MMAGPGAATSTTAVAADGTRLHVQLEGIGPVLVLLHEVAGDLRSWDLTVEALRGRYTCVRYDARGYGRSEVPVDAARYSQAIAAADALAVIEHVTQNGEPVLAVGFSMGGFCLLHAMLSRPDLFRASVVVGVGYGSNPDQRAVFQREMEVAARAFRADPRAAADAYAAGPTRRQLQLKAPERWQRLRDGLAKHDPTGQAHTFREVLGKRPTIHSLHERLTGLSVPTLLVVGDEDDGCLETNLLLKRVMDWSALTVLPRTGHTPHLEDPETFHLLVDDFFSRCLAGEWYPRVSGSAGRGLVGMGPSGVQGMRDDGT